MAAFHPRVRVDKRWCEGNTQNPAQHLAVVEGLPHVARVTENAAAAPAHNANALAQ